MTEVSSMTGAWVGQEHVLPMRVYYAETDAGGVVYHASYLNFAERARTEMTRLIGLDQVRLRADADLLFAVRSCEMEFLRPARLDDLLTVRSKLIHLGGASLHVAQSILRGTEELVTLMVRLVCMTGEAKAARIPNDLRDRLQSYLVTQETE
ncbi:MAG TPA: tol-pal system-associated acyl-CoA thioesterase [Candidatus Sulfotelmatobacter sp.]|nr:tol-pal system-associated acyl-CoA thioesterase [Candidatus Sulfotelmatobacter sp.]